MVEEEGRRCARRTRYR
jgi:hypothetical protein